MFLILSVIFVLDSCKKSDVSDGAGITGSDGILLHKYGLNSMTPDEYAGVPLFSASLFEGRPVGLPSPGTLPSSYLLTSPAIRDQGQTGACTAFCGSETNEILNYYKDVSPATIPGFTVSNAISTVINNKFVSPTSYFGVDGALAPNFLYYVESCVIEKQRITADPGANMVNIGEALQGLSSNSGRETALTLNGVTYKGECTEDLYPYPYVTSAQDPGYNVATISAAGFQVVPSSAAVSNATGFILGTQTGSTTATGATTTNGYYTITSSGDTTEVINCKIAITNNKPVMMGFSVYDNSSYTIFEGLNTTSYIYNPLIAKTTTKNGKSTTTYVLNTKLSLLGGHAVPLIGYVDDGTASTSATGGGYFVVQNSWGTPWGNNGYFLLPYSVLRNTTVVGSGSLYVAIL